MATDAEKEAAFLDVREKGNALADALNRAVDAGLGPAVILPELLTIFRASGLPIPGGVQLPAVDA